ncbi:MAG: glutamine-hydrolyzing carbamoyl-phosphate synthase small subunit [Gammaproteobacteria bacterium]|nr:glutamine-hydrolyzing carbamoyl-phosphate synthase small subunit [Gammaproteobacteria bacterium]
MTGKALLALADGSVFHGRSIGVAGHRSGEVVFNTAMTGYQEILTDPSYAKQLVTLTYPHIGNYGTNSDDVESERVWAEGLIIRDKPNRASNYRSEWSLDVYLKANDVVAISDIDTRRLTRLITSKGAMSACILAGENPDEDVALGLARAFGGLQGLDLAREVTRKEKQHWEGGGWLPNVGYRKTEKNYLRVVAYDFGVKNNILRCLTDRGCEVIVVPAQTSAEDALALKPDGIFYSNGPGDPEPCEYAIQACRIFLDKKVPLFGICLGHQILALASGAKTIKMPFGHHGANHPVKEMDSGRVLITSQNHGFAVDGDSLPDHLRLTHISLFDQSVQGIHHTEGPAFGFQGHPEASPGPQDCRPLFDHFIDLMNQSKTDA